MKYKGIVKKSRTLDAAMLIATLGVVELKFPILEELLGQWYGLSYIIVAVVMAYLRFKTTTPVGEKPDEDTWT